MVKATHEEVFIIDGYNVIHKIRDLKELIKKDIQSAREKFILLLNSYFAFKRVSVYVVFDGCNDITYFNVHNTPKIRVLFSKKNQKADILIKKIIDERNNKALTTVISSDHEVYQYAKVSLCKAIKSEEFIKKIKANSFDYENTVKSHSLSQEEIEEWKKIFL